MHEDAGNEREIRPFSATAVLEALGNDLSLIKRQDRLTYADMAVTLGKSEDMAAKYCEGTATMDVLTFARAWREWNGRAAGSLYTLCHESRPSSDTDRARQCKVLAAALDLSKALEHHNQVDGTLLRKSRKELEAARDAIDEILRRSE